MSSPLIDHIGILVADIEDAIARWTAASGYHFSPIARYRTERYSDHSGSEPHFHDARISFSFEGPPYVELMEFTGDGTHSAAQGEGFHHFGFVHQPDIEGRMRRLAELGIRDDGRSYDEHGQVILWFTDKRDLDGIRFEYVSTDPQPSIRDDGSELPTDDMGRKTLWADGVPDVSRPV